MPDDGHSARWAYGRDWAVKDARTGDPTEPLILVSNRGPIEFRFDDDGGIEPRRGAGGVVSGLLCAVRHRPVTWIALAMSDADRVAARQPIEPLPGMEHLAVRLVDVPKQMYTRYYNGISNSVLWFAQHYLLDPQRTSLAEESIEHDWEHGYRAINERVAQEVIAALGAGDQTPVLFQDYHLYLAPALVRERFPKARLAHFVHIPWPESRYWEMLPEAMVHAIFTGLAACDTVGFQTERDAHNFLLGAQRFLPGTRIAYDTTGAGTLHIARRRVAVRHFPIAVSPTEVLRSAKEAHPIDQIEELSQRMAADPEHKLIVRVDRIEPTKNIVRGFQAYERLLGDHEELHGQVTFLALLVPSRQDLAQYRAYEDEIRSGIERINQRFGRPDWQPVVALFGNNRARALACMHRYDVLLVNPLIDGMNLVVKEGGILNRRDGVIVLSRTAGAHEQLAEHVLGIPPLDIRATAEALYQALHMPLRERTARARRIRAVLRAEDATSWLDAQVLSLPVRSGDRVPGKRTRTRGVTTPAVAPVPLRKHDAVQRRRVVLPASRIARKEGEKAIVGVANVATIAGITNLLALDGRAKTGRAIGLSALDILGDRGSRDDVGRAWGGWRPGERAPTHRAHHAHQAAFSEPRHTPRQRSSSPPGSSSIQVGSSPVERPCRRAKAVTTASGTKTKTSASAMTMPAGSRRTIARTTRPRQSTVSTSA